MIYAPPYLLRRSVPKVKSIARSHRLQRVPAGAHKKVNTGKQPTNKHSITTRQTSKPQQEGNTRHHTTTPHLPSRTVTNRLSGVFVSHNEYCTLWWFQVA